MSQVYRQLKMAVWLVLICSAAFISHSLGGDTGNDEQGYVGSKACANCHSNIYESFLQTDMGQSMSEVTPAIRERFGSSAEIFDSKFSRHFQLFLRDGKLYQSEYQVDADGKDIFRNTQEISWFVGSGANGTGPIVKRNDYLFEAPMSFYTKLHGWALSPGYEFGDYGFDRPILPACISCHAGRPKPVQNGNGRFQDPPFAELAIGCETCHGPGQKHVAAELARSETGEITNPRKLSSWRADNICMSCHQAGDARVLRTGKTYRDFHPGEELDETLSIFLVPFTRDSAPKDDHLEHYLSMRLSKCYRRSEGRLSCITCHDPHQQPMPSDVSVYFRQKCLTCHTEKSCVVPLTLREKKTPPDDCVNCHMPKRDLKVISHSILTNHRIVAEIEEPFPDEAFRMTTPGLQDLVHLSENPSKHGAAVPPLTLLQAYGQVTLSHPEYRQRYWALAKQLEASGPNNVIVLEALADWALRKETPSPALAIQYLQSAVRAGATRPDDYEQLGRLLIQNDREDDAITVLNEGLKLIPFDAQLYRLSATANLRLGKVSTACDVATNGAQKFPQDDWFRAHIKECGRNQNLNSPP